MKISDETLEKIIKKTLSGYRVPVLERNLATEVIEALKKREQTRPVSRWSDLIRLACYWASFLILTMLIFSGTVTDNVATVLVIVLSPVIFMALTSSGRRRLWFFF